MANVTFDLRGDMLDARYAPGGAAHEQFASNFVTQVNAVGTGIIGAGYLDMDHGISQNQGLVFHGKGSVSTNNKMSVLIRCAFGQNTGNIAIWGITPPGYGYNGTAGALIDSTHIYQEAENYGAGSDLLVNIGTWTPVVDQYYDIVMLYDMSTASGNHCKIYVDNVLISAANGGVWPNPRLVDAMNIMVGPSPYQGASFTRIKVNEFVIWDDIINPSSVVLDSGSGPLNGQSRTSFVASAALDGGLFTDPGVTHVQTGTTYEFAGVLQTGTFAGGTTTDPGINNVLNGVAYEINGGNLTGVYVSPTVGNVKVGINYGVNGTSQIGTYDGSDRWTDPGVANVRLGIAYEADSTTNNRTGTLIVPSPANVLVGVGTDNTVGTFTTPTAGQIASAVWEEPTSSHTTAHTFGWFVKKLLTVAKFLGLK